MKYFYIEGKCCTYLLNSAIPIIDELNINVEQKNIGSLFIISNSLGQNVASGILTAEKSVLNLSHLPYGIYYLKIGEQNQRTFKILKFE
jgi:hypothetical protein